MTRDIVLVTVESLRYDYRDACPVFGDLETVEGITAGHYTRPSLAALLSGQYRAALETRVRTPTLLFVLQDAGYTTLGVSYSPQTTPAFGFAGGFDEYDAMENDGGSVSRGSALRERLAENRLVRAVHHRLRPKHATLDRLPRDGEAVVTAQELYDTADGPRFLWLHLMGSHRPYGWGAGSLPKRLDSKAARAAPGRLPPTLLPDERETIECHYRAALHRAGEHVRELREHVSDDAILVVAGDHGEELGEAGYYFHGGYRRRTVPALSRVPVGGQNIDVRGRIGLAALPSAIVQRVGLSPPREWTDPSDSGWLTLAPWAGSVSLRYTTDGGAWTVRDASAGDIERARVDAGTREHLSALGYR